MISFKGESQSVWQNRLPQLLTHKLITPFYKGRFVARLCIDCGIYMETVEDIMEGIINWAYVKVREEEADKFGNYTKNASTSMALYT